MDGPKLHFPSQMLCFPTSERFLVFWTRNRFGDDFGLRWGRFGHHFGVILHSKSGKSNPETTSETTSNFDAFFHRCLDHFNDQKG